MRMPDYRHNIVCIATILALLGSTTGVDAQSLRTEHTYKLDDGTKQAPAMLTDVSWLVGSWRGEAFGGTFEEVWNPASAGSMVGFFKLMDDSGSVTFYELMLLVEEKGSLNLKVKHFTDDFVAWEEKEDYVTFRLVKIVDGAVHFSGLSFHRIDDDEIHAFIALHNEDKVWEEKLIYRRQK